YSKDISPPLPKGLSEDVEEGLRLLALVREKGTDLEGVRHALDVREYMADELDIPKDVTLDVVKGTLSDMMRCYASDWHAWVAENDPDLETLGEEIDAARQLRSELNVAMWRQGLVTASATDEEAIRA